MGINLLREGLDLPEVSLVAILDADKEGFLRSEVALIQTIGRAARNVHGRVVMYADRITEAMERAISETNRRRAIQERYNKEHNITPQTVQKAVRDRVGIEAPDTGPVSTRELVTNPKDLAKTIKELEKEMFAAAQALEFERAAELRDQIRQLRESFRALPVGEEDSAHA